MPGTVNMNGAKTGIIFNGVSDETLIQGVPGKCIYVHAVIFCQVYNSLELTSYGLYDSEGEQVIPQMNSGGADASNNCPPVILPYNEAGWGVCTPGASLVASSSNGMDGLLLFSIR